MQAEVHNVITQLCTNSSLSCLTTQLKDLLGAYLIIVGLVFSLKAGIPEKDELKRRLTDEIKGLEYKEEKEIKLLDTYTNELEEYYDQVKIEKPIPFYEITVALVLFILSLCIKSTCVLTFILSIITLGFSVFRIFKFFAVMKSSDELNNFHNKARIKITQSDGKKAVIIDKKNN